MRSDFHMHTNFSTDADFSPEEMMEGAIEKGLKVICITDHIDKDYDEEEKEFFFDTDKYFEKLNGLKQKYRQKIDLRIGVETGLQPHLGEYYHKYVNKYPFDFVIGSVHLVRGIDPYYGELFRNQTDREAYRQTFEDTILDIKNNDDFDVLGHLDYIVRYSKEKERSYSYSEFSDQIDEILKLLISKGKGLELNTAGLKYGLPFAHPHMDVLKKYREFGGEILTIGSDAHKPEHIAYDFYKVKDILQECGFKYYTEFKERRPIFIQVG